MPSGLQRNTMHMLFQSEAAYRRRRSWMPRDGDEAAATTTVLTGRPSNSVRMSGPRRRGTSRSCKTSRTATKKQTTRTRWNKRHR
ncbi:hypothetical protein C6341_g23840 [Phytophthora cactorum]|uniref:Uncharacterized protein n=1 Tax=Phytophthora cactorum TaxID=29920 RepID=A0A8T1C4D7_9STRA|nr:hypothetical protein PC117_g18251 [Phytophthora cactorum]KAG3130195.1 hypothetical protein C6341_g23840 [Phytophthora cactorum]